MRHASLALFLGIASAASLGRAHAAPGEPETEATLATAKIDSFVEGLMKKRHVPGVSIAVVEAGKVVLAKGYGMASLELGVAATPETVYELASVTKTFTAAAVMMLVSDGKIALDDKINERLSDLPKAWKDVTVRHLLSHTSGIKSYTSTRDFPKTLRNDFTQRELIGLVSKDPLLFAPADKWDYSNTNYFLLGMLIETASGKTYGDFLAERIFRPLGMSNTRANDLHAIIPGRAQGYSWNGKELRIADYHSPTQPFAAGMLVSTVTDLAKWDAALESGTVLTKPTLEAMWTPARLNKGKSASYGLGWEIGKVNGHRVVAHGGGIPGFSTQLSRYTDDSLTVIVLTNLDGGQSAAIARGIAVRFVPQLAEKTEPIEDKDVKTSERIKRLFEGAQKGEIDTDLFTDEARKQLVPHIKNDKERLASFGSLKSFQLVERKEDGGGVFLRYRATFQNETLNVSVSLNAAGKIQGIGLRPED